jgi:hypothetical protein
MFISIDLKYHLLFNLLGLIGLPILIINLIAMSASNSGVVDGTLMYAFAQQGQVRCTNGSLVPSPTECPSTDVCPSPSGPNTVAYCSLREPTKPSPMKSDVEEQAEVAISTDKESYHPGEPVKIIIQNVGNQPLRVSGLQYNLTIINLDNNQSYPLAHGKTSILAVDSGASANATWNQLDDKGKQVSAGNYTVLAILDSLRVNATFAITQQ